MKRLFFLVMMLVYLMVCPYVRGQESPLNIPPSPTAAGLGEYLDFPVGLYTGIPGVDIPIWTLEGREMRVPISLSYHGGGVRVEENASSVGLGWSLRAGGMVSRTVRGLADEEGFGYIGATLPNSPETTHFFHDMFNQEADPEPDAFSFSFMGYSGKFVFDESGEAHIHPYQDIDIEYTADGTGFQTFTFITPDGTTYIFGENGNREATRTETYTYSVPAGSTLGNPNHEIEQSSSIRAPFTGWHLTTIIAPSNTETFSFTYANDSYEYSGTKKGKFGYRANGNVDFRKLTQTHYRITGRRLTEITCNTNGLSVEFEATQNREDVKPAPGMGNPKAYSKILIKDRDDTPQTVFRLTTDYFRNPLLDEPSSGILSEDEYQYLRLKLVSVQEFTGDESLSIPAYEFTYDEAIALPPKDAHTQDHWGYFNGNANSQNNVANYYSNYFMVPGYQGGVDNGPLFFYTYGLGNASSLQTVDMDDVQLINKAGTNREPAYPAVRAGILTKVKYPTRGTTEFEYEMHTYGYVGDIDFQEIVYQTEEPLAEVDRPWNEPDATDEEIVEYGPFVVGPDQTVEVQYEVEYAYEHASDFADGYSYTPNVVELMKVGDPNPIVRVYYTVDIDGGIIVEERPGAPVQAGQTPNPPQLTLLTPVDTYDDDSDFSPHGITAMVSGSFFHELESGESYLLRAKRAKAFDALGNNVRNNTRSWIQIVQSVQNDQINYVIHEFDAGGLRVSRKTDLDKDGGIPVIEEYEYQMYDPSGNDLGYSSGSLVAKPEHFRSTYFYEESGTPVIVNSAPNPNSSFFNSVLGWFKDLFGITAVNNGQYQISGFTYLVFEMDSDHPGALGSTQGSHLGYRMVKVRKPGNGYTIYQHSTAFEYPDVLPSTLKWMAWIDVGNIQSLPTEWGEYDIHQDIPSFYYPFLSKKDMDWKRGLLLEKTVYREDQAYMSKEVNSFDFDEVSTVPGFRTIFSGVEVRFLNINLVSNPWVEYIDYEFVSGWPKLSQTIHYTFNQVGSGQVSTTTERFYEGQNHAQMTRSRVTNSDGQVVENRYKFPRDYAPFISLGSNSSLTINDLLDDNMVGIPIETQSWVGTGSSLAMSSASVTTFEDFNNSGSGDKNIRPFETYSFESPIPVVITQSQNGSGEYLDVIPVPSMYTKKTELEYANQGPVVQFQRPFGEPVSFIWAHDQSALVAQVNNARAEEIAYSSFEEAGATSDGNWTITVGGSTWTNDSKTGTKSFHMPTSSAKVEKVISESGSYTISFWYKGRPRVIAGSLNQLLPNATDWTFWEKTLSLNSGHTVRIKRGSGAPKIDELRLHPSDGLMTSIVYDPALRQQTVSEAGSLSNYFEYDDFGRLEYVRDQDGNYIQQYKYHYRN
ncbi:MAG: hypothetical protein AAF587_12965 [Bacteroidota bacterium]